MDLHGKLDRSGGRSHFAIVGLLAVLFAAVLAIGSFASPAFQGTKPGPSGGQGGPPGGPGGQGGPGGEQDGGDIVFQVVGNRMQKKSVLYSHEEHLSHGLKCDDCHEKVFKKKLNANKFKMADINKGEFCGACHTEKPAEAMTTHKAFPPKGNCAKCHTLSVREP